MVPEKLFRTQGGCVFETTAEANEQSINEAVDDIVALLTKDGCIRESEELIKSSAIIKKAVTVLTKALDGKAITTYTL